MRPITLKSAFVTMVVLLALAACGEDGNKTDSEAKIESFEVLCEKMCTRLGECVPEMALKTLEDYEGPPEARQLLEQQAKAGPEGAARCKAGLCAMGAERSDEDNLAQAKLLDACVSEPNCKKFTGCLEGLGAKARKAAEEAAAAATAPAPPVSDPAPIP